MRDLFDVGDVIHSYGDAQALADGMLVDLPGMGATVTFHGRQVDRMSRALYEAVRPFVAMPVANPVSAPRQLFLGAAPQSRALPQVVAVDLDPPVPLSRTKIAEAVAR